jgi:probable addiction module antidote protein
MRDRSHDDAMAELYEEDPALALAVLNDILGDKTAEQGELLIALRQMTKAFGGVKGIAKQAELNPNQLYRTLSEQGNPELQTLTAVLRAMGLRLAVEPVKPVNAQKPRQANKTTQAIKKTQTTLGGRIVQTERRPQIAIAARRKQGPTKATSGKRVVEACKPKA